MTWPEAVKKMAEHYHNHKVPYANARTVPEYPGISGKLQADCSGFVTACVSLFAGDGKYHHTSTAGMFPDDSWTNWAKGLGFSARAMTPEEETVIKENKQKGVVPNFLQPFDIIRHSQEGYGGPKNGHTYIIGEGNTRYEMSGSRNGNNGMPGSYYNDGPKGRRGIFKDWHIIRHGGGFSPTSGGSSGGGSGSGSAGWAGDWDEKAAAADASRGKKIFSRTTAQTNILGLLFTGEDSSAFLDSDIIKTPPRIWQYFPPSIVMPTISFPVNPWEEEEPWIDPSLGKAIKKKVKKKLEAEEKKKQKEAQKTESDPKKIAENENKSQEEKSAKTKKKESSKEKNKDKSKNKRDKTKSKEKAKAQEKKKEVAKKAQAKKKKATETEEEEDLEEKYKRGTGEQARLTHEKWAEGESLLGYKVKEANYSVKSDLEKDLGRSFPIVYINDHMFSEDEIVYMKIDCMGFLPTIELHVSSHSKSIVKENLPKEGDTIGVFIQYTHTLIRPLRCDFQINAAVTKSISQEHQTEYMSMVLYGDLKVPDLYNSNISFEYMGSSRNALIDIAQKLKLGFCFNDNEDTMDAQCWYCTPEQSGDPATYMEDLITHLYKDSSSFYSGWIDPRYNLTVLNVRQMLGTTADCDEGLDITKMVSVINNNYFDGNRQEKKKSIITPKIFNNFMSDQSADTYYVYDYKLINQASEISNKMGLLVHSNFGINATGLPASLTIEINPQLCLNWEKIDGVTAKGVPTNARYLALVGPGINRNQNDNPPENGKYTESKTKKNALIDVNVQSDDDAEMARNAPSNRQFDIKPPLLAAENPPEKITLETIKQENQGESAWTGEGWRNLPGFDAGTTDTKGSGSVSEYDRMIEEKIEDEMMRSESGARLFKDGEVVTSAAEDKQLQEMRLRSVLTSKSGAELRNTGTSVESATVSNIPPDLRSNDWSDFNTSTMAIDDENTDEILREWWC